MAGKPVPLDRWQPWLDALPRTALFAVAPDVPFDAAGTLALSERWLPEVRAMGYRVAFAGQDGMSPDDPPWGGFDVLFVGGSTAWKEGHDAQRLVQAAQERGVATHMGRVNTWRRMRIAASWGIDSVDGTKLAFGAIQNLPQLLRWLDQLEHPQLALPS